MIYIIIFTVAMVQTNFLGAFLIALVLGKIIEIVFWKTYNWQGREDRPINK